MEEDIFQMEVKKLSATAQLPIRATPGSAGYDLFANANCVIPARGKGIVPTGLAIRVPDGTYGRIAPRSSIGWKHFVDVGCGVIDQDYTNEVNVVLYNHSGNDFQIAMGDRIAQLILEKIETVEVRECVELAITERKGGFGSTGVAGAPSGVSTLAKDAPGGVNP